MEQAAPARTLLFLLVTTALVATAIAFRSSPGPSASAGASGLTGATGASGLTGSTETSEPNGLASATGPAGNAAVRARAVLAQLRRKRGAVRRAARRFLFAFLRYETGDLSPSVRRALHAGATRGFAHRLLSNPPHPSATGHFPPRAALQRLNIAFVSSPATRVVVSGTARRGALGEEFSFVFVQRDSRWLASGPGE